MGGPPLPLSPLSSLVCEGRATADPAEGQCCGTPPGGRLCVGGSSACTYGSVSPHTAFRSFSSFFDPPPLLIKSKGDSVLPFTLFHLLSRFVLFLSSLSFSLSLFPVVGRLRVTFQKGAPPREGLTPPEEGGGEQPSYGAQPHLCRGAQATA